VSNYFIQIGLHEYCTGYVMETENKKLLDME